MLIRKEEVFILKHHLKISINEGIAIMLRLAQKCDCIKTGTLWVELMLFEIITHRSA